MEWAGHVGRRGSSFTRTATSENQNVGLAHLSAHFWAHFWAHTWLTLGSLLAQPKVSPEVSPVVNQSGPTLVHAKQQNNRMHCVNSSTAQHCTSIALISHFPQITQQITNNNYYYTQSNRRWPQTYWLLHQTRCY